MPDFSFRALELHSAYVWDFDWVRKALGFIRAHELTALVLHRNDIVDQVVYPARLFGGSGAGTNIFERYQEIHRALYRYTPTRRSGPYQRRDYLRRVIDLAARQSVTVWFENKELYFPDILPELAPEVVKEGTICPNAPFWWEFLGAKYTELFEDLPGLCGVITAPGTGESRLAISANRCRCALCRETSAPAWYRALIGAMHPPVRRAGATLAVRDFVFDRKAAGELARAIEELPSDIIISLKNTPHDYYPTFPDNPRLGHVGRHRQWIEYDCMGQYFGWGLAPAIMIEDLARRFATARAAGAEGVILRTDWESLDAHSAFHTPNLINLLAGAGLARDLAADRSGLYRAWLEERNMLRGDAGEAARAEAARWLESLLGASWEITRRTVFAQDCVFSDSTNLPVSFAHAWWLAEEKNSLADWDPAKEGALAPDAANVRRILAEKDAALALLDLIAPLLAEPPAALTAVAAGELAERLEVFRLIVQGFRAATQALILTRFLLAPEAAADPFAPEATARRGEALVLLLGLAASYEEFARRTDLRHTVYTLLSPERLRALHADLCRQMPPDRPGGDPGAAGQSLENELSGQGRRAMSGTDQASRARPAAP